MIELLQKHKNAIQELTQAGVISPTWLRDLRIIEAYENLKIKSKMMKYEILAGRFDIDSDTVRRIIKRMK